MKRLKSLILVLVLPAVTPFLIGCSILQDTRIPGVVDVDSTFTEIDHVPSVSEVQEAIREQYAKALSAIPSIKNDPENFPNADGLNPQTGVARFSGKTQLIQTDSGNILGVFPFTGYAGSTLSPNFGISSKATGIQDCTLSFSIDPNTPTSGNSRQIGESDYLAKKIKSLFEEVARLKKGSATDPRITTRELMLSTTFSIARTLNGGLGVSFLPSTDDIDSLAGAPLLGAQSLKIGTYKVDIKIPMVVASVGDSRRIYEGVFDPSNGRLLMVERPYEKDAARAILGSFRRGSAGVLFVDPGANDDTLPLFVEPENER